MLATALHGAFPRPKREKLHSATRGSSPPRDRTQISCTEGGWVIYFFFFRLVSPGKPRYWIYKRAIPSAPDALGVESTLKRSACVDTAE